MGGGTCRNAADKLRRHIVEAALRHCPPDDWRALASEFLGFADQLIPLVRGQFDCRVVTGLLRMPEHQHRAPALLRPASEQIHASKYGCLYLFGRIANIFHHLHELLPVRDSEMHHPFRADAREKLHYDELHADASHDSVHGWGRQRRIALAARGDVTESNDRPDFSHSDTANTSYGLPLLLSFVLVDGSTSTSQQQFSCQR